MGSSIGSTDMNEIAATDDACTDPPAVRFVEPQVGAVEILDRLEREDAIAVPVLTDAYRAWLLEEGRAAPFARHAPSSVGGERLVRQRMGVHDGFGRDSRFHDLTGHYQALWDGWLASVAPCPFESPLVFNDLMLQVYEPGETGITPHMDRTAYRNLICLFVLEGRGRFGVCKDRSGRGARIIAHDPGDVVLTRAPGSGAPTAVRSTSSIESRSGATCSDCGTSEWAGQGSAFVAPRTRRAHGTGSVKRPGFGARRTLNRPAGRRHIAGGDAHESLASQRGPPGSTHADRPARLVAKLAII